MKTGRTNQHRSFGIFRSMNARFHFQGIEEKWRRERGVISYDIPPSMINKIIEGVWDVNRRKWKGRNRISIDLLASLNRWTRDFIFEGSRRNGGEKGEWLAMIFLLVWLIKYSIEFGMWIDENGKNQHRFFGIFKSMSARFRFREIKEKISRRNGGEGGE